MVESGEFEIFLVVAPGLERELCAEARMRKFKEPVAVHGGVTIKGGWTEVWRANLEIRGAARVLVRVGSFRALHLAQLDKRASAFGWQAFLRPDVPVRVEASCKASRIYHSDAAAERIGKAITAKIGAAVSEDSDLIIKARIEDDLCTISIDSSGEALHKRGHKEAIGKAPMRETMTSLFLHRCGYRGVGPVVDPMCGSGTFIIEAAEIAAGLYPGRSRPFAFQQLVNFDPGVWDELRAAQSVVTPATQFFGSDRDAGAIRMSKANAERAGVSEFTQFERRPISDVTPPDGEAGLVIINPPYGARIGDKKKLFGLYGALGKMLLANFGGWRVGIITTDASLAQATGLPLKPTGKPVLHGGLRVVLHQAGPL